MHKKLDIDGVFNPKRPKLGNFVAVPVFRVLRHIALEDIIGQGGSGIVYRAGKQIGLSLDFENVDDFLDWVEKAGIGIPELEKSSNPIVARIYECVTCSGIPNIGRPVCHFEGGLIAGFLERLLNKKLVAKEVKCWGLGYEVCEFEVREVKL
ncbi:V4R domain-containing protein [Archaeoglobus sp.]